ncbi:MAG TPA: histidine phosphatase family protein [Candidatus Paceibacterota bacterium]|nr:histidine phosphatase family protein [Candidatus Pacearchaeota archaeon]HRZ51332.1 histidine phosphatase family protein [Candidatus Paceibacterota bacterium]HSA37054.1 histidine phosphatase family protein [Candidatus Paceibacterota bacterium]
MNIYFVRHGQTKMNEFQLSQSEHEPLSETGLKQAQMIAQRVKTLPVEIIHASPMKRASQAAEIIREAIDKEIIYSDLIKEHRRPSVMIGHANEEEFVKKINYECNQHQNDISWHYSDEENFLEYKTRARKALEYLSALPQKNILVVSHGNFIKMLVLTMALGDLIQPAVLYSFANKFRLRNTGLTYCKKTATGWSIEAFNDHQHLG